MNKNLISKIGFGFISTLLMLPGVAFAAGFQDLVNTFKNYGVFQFYLPFILVFAVFYGLLMRVNLFGGAGTDNKGGKAINIIVSLAIAGFMMVYTPVGITFSQFLANFAGNSIVVILSVIVVMILVSMLTSVGLIPRNREGHIEFLNPGIIIPILLLTVALVFFASGGSSIFPGVKNPLGGGGFDGVGGMSNTTLALLILIIGTGLIIFFFARGNGGGGGGAPAGGAGGGAPH